LTFCLNIRGELFASTLVMGEAYVTNFAKKSQRDLVFIASYSKLFSHGCKFGTQFSSSDSNHREMRREQQVR